MADTFRALCAELHEALEKRCETLEEDRLLDRSAAALRAALAQPEPEGVTDDELMDMAEFYIEDNGLLGLHNAGEFARVAIAADRARAALAQSEPVAPTDEALANFSGWFCRNYPGPDTIIHKPEWHAPKVFRVAADAIARWGTPANQPVALTDEELGRRFRDWWHDEGSGLPPLPGMDHKEHVRRISEIAWANGAYVARYGTPANALPTPEPTNA